MHTNISMSSCTASIMSCWNHSRIFLGERQNDVVRSFFPRSGLSLRFESPGLKAAHCPTSTTQLGEGGTVRLQWATQYYSDHVYNKRSHSRINCHNLAPHTQFTSCDLKLILHLRQSLHHHRRPRHTRRIHQEAKMASLQTVVQTVAISSALIGAGGIATLSAFDLPIIRSQPADRALPSLRWLFSRGSHVFPTAIVSDRTPYSDR
jgi:hypothetical protein